MLARQLHSYVMDSVLQQIEGEDIFTNDNNINKGAQKFLSIVHYWLISYLYVNKHNFMNLDKSFQNKCEIFLMVIKNFTIYTIFLF